MRIKLIIIVSNHKCTDWQGSVLKTEAFYNEISTKLKINANYFVCNVITHTFLSCMQTVSE